MGGRTIIWSISDRTPRQVFDETISAGDTMYNFASRGVAQLVAHLLWEQEAGSSSLLSPTNSFHPTHLAQHFSPNTYHPILSTWQLCANVGHEHFRHLHQHSVRPTHVAWRSWRQSHVGCQRRQQVRIDPAIHRSRGIARKVRCPRLQRCRCSV